MKRLKGEREHPCLRPLEDLKKEEGPPLIKTTKEVVDIQFITH
jgi:hypothetical protein